MEDEDVSYGGEFFVGAHVGSVEGVTFFGSEVERSAVLLGANGVFAEWVVLCVAHVDAPEPVGADCAHVCDDGVVGALLWYLLMVGVVPNVFVFLVGDKDRAVLVFLRLEEGVLFLEELGEGYECVSCGFVKVDGLAGVELEPFDDVEDYSVALVTLNGDLLEFEEVFNLVIEAMLVRLGGFKLVGVEEFVDGLLGPFECEVFDGNFVAVLFDCGYNSVNRGFCV